VNFTDLPIVFDCEGDRLVGVLSVPETPIGIGVVVIVGGPQYRAGSHRQFVHLARAVAAAGVATLRFDYRGMGDSEGSPRPFDAVDADIACAVGELKRRVPAVRRVVLWGLCDGASAAFIALRSLPDIAGAIALNPWVRSETSLDQAILQRYYVQRVLSREFWAKLASGRFEPLRALKEFARRLLAAISGSRKPSAEPQSFRDRMADGLKQFRGSVLIVLSGRT
jgi:exosortase A-associated hydrolase 1